MANLVELKMLFNGLLGQNFPSIELQKFGSGSSVKIRLTEEMTTTRTTSSNSRELRMKVIQPKLFQGFLSFFFHVTELLISLTELQHSSFVIYFSGMQPYFYWSASLIRTYP